MNPRLRNRCVPPSPVPACARFCLVYNQASLTLQGAGLGWTLSTIGGLEAKLASLNEERVSALVTLRKHAEPL
jgi:hypothetical protein